MKILVCGGHKFFNREFVFAGLNAFVEVYGKPSFLVQGDAPGVDKDAKLWAHENRIPHSGKTYKAQWTVYGVAAGPIRNKLMLDSEHPDYTISFPGGPGTHNMVEQSFGAGVPVIRVTLNRIMHEPVNSMEEWNKLWDHTLASRARLELW